MIDDFTDITPRRIAKKMRWRGHWPEWVAAGTYRWEDDAGRQVGW